MNDIVIISPAMMKLFSECKGKFFYRYMLQIPSPIPEKGFLTGKNIHAIASYYLKGYDITKFEKILSSKEEECWKYLKTSKYFNYDIAGIEMNLTVRRGKFWIGGRIDAIVRNGYDYYILDYKTGSVEDDMTYDYQTMVYLLLCSAAYNDYSSLNFVYLDLKNKKEVFITLTEDLKAEYSGRIEDICKKISSIDKPEFEHQANCRCEYSGICKNKSA